MAHRTLFPPPDEKRALEQLERFHREILRARRERERAGAEFEGFVQGFRDERDERPRQVPAEPPGRRVPRPVIPAAVQPAHPAVPPQPPAPTAAPPSAVPTPEAPAAPVIPAAEPVGGAEPIPALAAPPRGGRKLFLALTAGFLIGALGALYFWQRSQPPAAPPAESARSTTPAAPVPVQPAPQPQAPSAASPPQPAPAPTVSPSAVQVTTDRTVWLRVIVDGQKVLEREVPAGWQLTYTPAASIVIRAGDAGAVRVKVGGGAEAVLGRNAFPLTRRFEVPAKP